MDRTEILLVFNILFASHSVLQEYSRIVRNCALKLEPLLDDMTLSKFYLSEPSFPHQKVVIMIVPVLLLAFL